MKRAVSLLLCLLLAFGVYGSHAEESTAGYASYELLDTNRLPPELAERKLTDEQIAALLNAPLDQLRTQISTFADYVAWVEAHPNVSFATSVTSNPQSQVTLDPDFCFGWAKNMMSTVALVTFAQDILSDDYPGMGTAMAVTVSSAGHDWIYANVFPVEDGYLVLGAGSYAKNILDACNWGMNVIEPLRTDDLTGIIAFCQGPDLKWHTNGKNLSQVLLFDSTSNLVLDWENPFYVPKDSTHVTELYRNADVLYPTEPLDLKPYKLPKDLGTSSSLDADTARTLSRSSLEELADAIRSVPDLLTYMHYAAFTKYDGDLTLELQHITWHYNYAPDVVFRKNAGNCGATAAYVQYLLQGDYDEVGIIGLTYDRNLGGGHVINYIRQGKTYYILDFNGWVSTGHNPSSLRLCSGKDLKAAAQQYKKSTGSVALMVAYQTEWGDAPIGWDNSDTSYLISDYAQNVQILVEGYPDASHYEFIDESETVRQLIPLSQSAW